MWCIAAVRRLTGTTSAGELVRTLRRVSLRACTGTGLGHDEMGFRRTRPHRTDTAEMPSRTWKVAWGHTPGHPVCPVPAFIVAPWPSVFWSFSEHVMADGQTPDIHPAWRALLRSAHTAATGVDMPMEHWTAQERATAYTLALAAVAEAQKLPVMDT